MFCKLSHAAYLERPRSIQQNMAVVEITGWCHIEHAKTNAHQKTNFGTNIMAILNMKLRRVFCLRTMSFQCCGLNW